MIRREEDTGGAFLIKNEIEQTRRQLRTKDEEYATLQTTLQELADTRRRLRLKLEQLEQDEKALVCGQQVMKGATVVR